MGSAVQEDLLISCSCAEVSRNKLLCPRGVSGRSWVDRLCHSPECRTQLARLLVGSRSDFLRPWIWMPACVERVLQQRRKSPHPLRTGHEVDVIQICGDMFAQLQESMHTSSNAPCCFCENKRHPCIPLLSAFTLGNYVHLACVVLPEIFRSSTIQQPCSTMLPCGA